jgi:hypothetical protein
MAWQEMRSFNETINIRMSIDEDGSIQTMRRPLGENFHAGALLMPCLPHRVRLLELQGKRLHPEMTRATFSHLSVESKPFAPAESAAIPVFRPLTTAFISFKQYYNIELNYNNE